ncbi:hypothetical protein BJI47_16975 [Rhodococcus sp. 1168]|nr:hypothetical protein BJI47_16975 [Rhodococcus sp. 1168]
MGLQVRIYRPRKRTGVSSCPQIEADVPNVLWAMNFQVDSIFDGKAIKISSMIDEHTRLSLLKIVKCSITAERLADELDKTFALCGGPLLARGWTTDRSLFPLHCNSSAQTALEFRTFRREIRGTTGTSSRSITDFGGNT